MALQNLRWDYSFVLILHLHRVGRGVKTLLAELPEMLAKTVFLSPKLFQTRSLRWLLFLNASSRRRSSLGTTRLPPSTHYIAGLELFRTMANFDQPFQDLIPPQWLITPEDSPVLGGLKMILCSVESIRLIGQTCYSDGAPLCS